jgi:hypothetical protein
MAKGKRKNTSADGRSGRAKRNKGCYSAGIASIQTRGDKISCSFCPVLVLLRSWALPLAGATDYMILRRSGLVSPTALATTTTGPTRGESASRANPRSSCQHNPEYPDGVHCNYPRVRGCHRGEVREETSPLEDEGDVDSTSERGRDL